MDTLYDKIHRIVVINYLNDLKILNMTPEVFSKVVMNKLVYGVTYNNYVENLISKVLDKIKHENL